ncbi:hypothetical protein GOP47_0016692 [Adiantum capillus-veneris]|uniref:Proline-rich protein PRCC n=1 Tax=Adiantum capillus-veneris TaxID=13818 RepID=A0A9D4ZBY7_ADICA|nr:hypothetical protein GOP47_0016692 [Adiantum capillus-veneris]
MESLLANYGSDDEEDPQQQHTRAPLLPPPKVQDDRSTDVATRRSSLFSSLPRPKLASEDKWKSHSTDTEYRDKKKASDVTIIAGRRDGFRHKGTEDDSMIAADRFSELSKQGSNARSVATPSFSDGVNGAPSTRVSLFRVLPSPNNVGSSVAPLTSQGPSGPASKRVVEIRPTINMALLQEPDDDDDVLPPVKRHATEGTKLTGLAAILPKPKNLGSALGSGIASGHQATLDLGTPATSLPAVESTLGSGYASGHQNGTLDAGEVGSFLPSGTEAYESLTMSHQHASESWSNHVDYSGHTSTFGSWQGHNVDANFPEAPELNGMSAPYLSTAAQEGAEAHYSENYYYAPDAYSQEVAAHEMSAQDALAEMLMREKRKGGKKAPVNVIEVKQADLTATKVREDQLRTTGIAFGPAYKPMATSKNKPSKLHRRKHQIGSLYYDMRQKETELMERRAKGYMTKAETQAKYGW